MEVKTLSTDRCHEYLLNMFKEYCEGKVISTYNSMHSRNGIVKSRNRTLFDMVMSMMAHADLSIGVYIFNRESQAIVYLLPHRSYDMVKSCF